MSKQVNIFIELNINILILISIFYRRASPTMHSTLKICMKILTVTRPPTFRTIIFRISASLMPLEILIKKSLFVFVPIWICMFSLIIYWHQELVYVRYVFFRLTPPLSFDNPDEFSVFSSSIKLPP